MADILGAAAGCGMMVMIVGLIGCFLKRISVIKAEVVKACLFVCSICGVFAVGEYGLMLLMEKGMYGTEAVSSFSDILRHGLFAHLLSSAVPVHTFLQLQYIVMALSGMLIYAAAKTGADEQAAKKGTVLFYMLPGAELFFLPVSFGWVPLAAAAVVFLLRKQFSFRRMTENDGVMTGMYAVFGIVKCLVLYRMVSGV